ncbi:hypothetical protein BC940DRAFT_323200 [Gongronella butleri]|nr:hypothetical protein BC940DRAFT_323200 [Gongronella butleri]
MNSQVGPVVRDRVIDRMDDAFLPTDLVTPDFVTFLLTNQDATLDDHQRLMNDHCLVNDEELVRTLGLLPAPEQVQAGMAMYVGMVTGPNTPLNRVDEDAQNRGGLMGHFLNVIANLAPGDAQGVQFNVYVLPIAVQYTGANQHQIDAYEQATIAYFGLNKLLNRQPGGFMQYYAPSAEEVHAHRGLYPTQLHRYILSHSRGVPDGVISRLALWNQNLRNTMDDDAEIFHLMDGIQRQQGTNYLDMAFDQAVPSFTVVDRVLVCAIADAIPIEGVRTATPFFTHGSRAGHVATDSFNRAFNNFHDDDDPSPYLNEDNMESTYREPRSVVPFLDLHPWPSTQMRPDLALAQITTYLQAVQPLVTVTLSKHVASAAMANFLHTTGMPINDTMLDAAGLPFVSYYPGQAWVNNAALQDLPTDYVTIVVPHIHPGYTKYGVFTDAFYRILDLTWKITCLICEIAVTVCRQLEDSELIANVNNEAICKMIMLEVDPKSNLPMDPRLEAAYAALVEAKLEHKAHLHQRLMRQAPHPPMVDTRSHQMAAVSRVEHAPVAQGLPGSPVREAQINMLWKMNLAQLHIHLGRDQQQQWLNWARQLATNTNMYMSSMRLAGMANERFPAMHLLRQFRPDGYDEDDDSWMDIPEEVVAAWGRWSRAIASRLADDHYSHENQLARGVLSTQLAHPETFDQLAYQPMTVMENRVVHVRTSGRTRLYWLENDDTHRPLEVVFPKNAMPVAQYPTQTGFGRNFRLRFYENGIGVDNPVTGHPVLLNNDPVLLDLGRLGGGPDGHHVLRMWESEWRRIQQQQIQEQGHLESVAVAPQPPGAIEPAIVPVRPDVALPEPAVAAPDPMQVDYPPFEEIPPNQRRHIFRTRTSQATKDAFGTIHDTDAIGLLRLYLDTHHQHGGVVNTAGADLVDYLQQHGYQSVPLFHQFRAFCTASHQNHPCYRHWIDLLDRLPRTGNDIRVCIEYLREDIQIGQHRYTVGPGVQRGCLTISFGEPIAGRERLP